LKVALLKGFPFGLPLLAQPGDHRGRQPRRRAQQLGQRWDEVGAGQPVQVQKRQHRGDLRAAPDPPGQDHALELLPLPGRRVDSPVVHPRTHHLDLADTGGDRAGWGVAVTAHQAVAALIARLGTGDDVGVDLGFQRNSQHPAGTLTEQSVQVQRELGSCLLVSD
jgi:hypothetical protein